MITIKSYTDLEQSKKLAEILPRESADGVLCEYADGSWHYEEWVNKPATSRHEQICWSLAALLDVMSSATLDSSDDHHYRVHCKEMFTDWYYNPVDACYEMILKLHKLKML